MLPEPSIVTRLVEWHQLSRDKVTEATAIRRVATEFNTTIAKVKEALNNDNTVWSMGTKVKQSCKVCEDQLKLTDGYCATCHPNADMFTDPDGNLDFGESAFD